MAHDHLRKEKNCLNCGREVPDRFCTHCGQENLEPRESLGHMVVHFFNDVTHFDGKFFSTIRHLLGKPGFLSAEYMAGRRARYVNPVRMYLFISFVLFLAEFSLHSPAHHDSEPPHNAAHALLAAPEDSLRQVQARRSADSLEKLEEAQMRTVAEGVKVKVDRGNVSIDMGDSPINQLFQDVKDSTVSGYLATQKALPPEKRHSWSERWIVSRMIGIDEYQRDHPKTWGKDLANVFFHSIPKMLFVSIPMYAFILWMLYYRSRKRYYFVSHGIFTIHLYCAIYLVLLLILPLDFIDNPVVNGVSVVIITAGPALYQYIAMKRFYQQSHGKTIVKFLLITMLSLLLFIILLLVFFMNSLFSLATQSGH